MKKLVCFAGVVVLLPSVANALFLRSRGPGPFVSRSSIRGVVDQSRDAHSPAPLAPAGSPSGGGERGRQAPRTLLELLDEKQQEEYRKTAAWIECGNSVPLLPQSSRLSDVFPLQQTAKGGKSQEEQAQAHLERNDYIAYMLAIFNRSGMTMRENVNCILRFLVDKKRDGTVDANQVCWTGQTVASMPVTMTGSLYTMVLLCPDVLFGEQGGLGASAVRGIRNDDFLRSFWSSPNLSSRIAEDRSVEATFGTYGLENVLVELPVEAGPMIYRLLEQYFNQYKVYGRPILEGITEQGMSGAVFPLLYRIFSLQMARCPDAVRTLLAQLDAIPGIASHYFATWFNSMYKAINPLEIQIAEAIGDCIMLRPDILPYIEHIAGGAILVYDEDRVILATEDELYRILLTASHRLRGILPDIVALYRQIPALSARGLLVDLNELVHYVGVGGAWAGLDLLLSRGLNGTQCALATFTGSARRFAEGDTTERRQEIVSCVASWVTWFAALLGTEPRHVFFWEGYSTLVTYSAGPEYQRTVSQFVEDLDHLGAFEAFFGAPLTDFRARLPYLSVSPGFSATFQKKK